MELLLNLAWLLIAGVIVCLWLSGGSHEGPDRRGQFIAVVMLIAILFPVISVSDDLLAIQNAAEADNYLRRDHRDASYTHPVQPMPAIVASVLSAGPGFGFSRFMAPGLLQVQKPEHPELAGIWNRPPPNA
jgi:hypothetical protein